MIMKFADGSMFTLESAQDRDVLIEAVMRPGMSLTATAPDKKDLRPLEDMFDEDAPEPRETMYLYPNETDPQALQKSLDGLPEGIPGPAGADKPKIGYTKVGGITYEKYRLPQPEDAKTIPEPQYAWRLTVEIGQRAYNEQ